MAQRDWFSYHGGSRATVHRHYCADYSAWWLWATVLPGRKEFLIVGATIGRGDVGFGFMVRQISGT